MADLATKADVARLFGRAAFGATGADLDTWTGQSYEDVVDSLFPPGPPGTAGRAPQADEAARVALEAGTNDIATPQRWWLNRMRTTPYPIEERMTLFWHDHFATAYTGQPNAGAMMVQNQTLRTHALGSFHDLANAMLVDPAMLIWLNGIANHVNGINENLAREFLELFTLGVVPQVYTETDIRQAAKVLTGFTVNTVTKVATFQAARHDNSVKVVLGRVIGGNPQAAPTEYKQLTEAALAHDLGVTTSRFLAYKLVQEFGYPVALTDVATDPLVQDVAWAIRAGDAWDLRRGVRTLLLHPGWRYADPALDRLYVRSPVELVVHGAKVLGIEIPAVNAGQSQLVNASAARAGQAPFVPPNVGGWPHGLGWLSQTTTLGRYDMLNTLWNAYRNQQRHLTAPPPPVTDLAYWTWWLGLASLSTSTTLRLQEYLAAPGTTVVLDRQASLFILLGASPDWQVM
jgi:uncharacterized protein (DUF1800 family)